MKKQFNKAIIGTISHCTMREEDLIESFIDELERLNNNKHTYKSIINEGKKIIKKGEYDTEYTSEYLNETLWNALDELALPYTYFGSNEGDGSDFGFWPYNDIENDFEGLKVSDLSEVPEKYTGEVLYVNDHGNTSLYNCKKGNLKEIWSIV
jgi:hypothetical protein